MVEMHAPLATRAIPCLERLTAIFRGEIFDESRIWLESSFAAVKLLFSAEDNIRASLDRVDGPANVDDVASQAMKIDHGFFVLTETEDKEMTVGVGGLWAADIQKMDPVRRIHHAIDMRRDADVFIQVLQSIIGRDTRALRPREGGGQDGEHRKCNQQWLMH